MPSITATLPLQLLCQMIASTPGAFNGTDIGALTLEQLPSRIESVARLPPGYVPYPDVGVAYKVHDEIVSWKVAKKECNLEGGHLALIDSYKKLSYVLAQRQSNKLTHVGIQRMYDDEDWVGLSTGLPASGIPWAAGEPGGSWDCVMIKNDENGLTNDQCTKRGDFVCELPIPGDSIVQGNLVVKISAN